MVCTHGYSYPNPKTFQKESQTCIQKSQTYIRADISTTMVSFIIITMVGSVTCHTQKESVLCVLYRLHIYYLMSINKRMCL